MGCFHREDIQTRHHCMMLWADMPHSTGYWYLAGEIHKSGFTNTGDMEHERALGDIGCYHRVPP